VKIENHTVLPMRMEARREENAFGNEPMAKCIRVATLHAAARMLDVLQVNN